MAQDTGKNPDGVRLNASASFIGAANEVRRTGPLPCPPETVLAADAQTGDQIRVARVVHALDIIKQGPARGHHLQQPAA